MVRICDGEMRYPRHFWPDNLRVRPVETV